MAVLNSILNLSKEMVEWRRYLHTIPELGLKEFKTSEFISNKLKEWNIQHECKIAETGIVNGGPSFIDSLKVQTGRTPFSIQSKTILFVLSVVSNTIFPPDGKVTFLLYTLCT